MPTKTQLIDQIKFDLRDEGWEQPKVDRFISFLTNNVVSGTSGTDYVAPGNIVVSHKDGTQTIYSDTTNTDSGRGSKLVTAVSASVDTDNINLGPGIYDIGNHSLDLSKGGTGSVHLAGSGKNTTTIKHQCSFATNGAAVHPGDTSVVSDLTIQATTDLGGGDYEVGWGRGYASVTGGTPQTAFTQAILRNVLIIGRTDCIIIEGNTDECDAEFQDCEFRSNWDCFGVNSCTQASTFTRRNCKFFTDGTNTASAGEARCTHLAACTVRDFNCEMRAINTNNSPSNTNGYYTGAGSIVEVNGGSIVTSASSGNVYDINKLASSSGALFKVSGGTSFNLSKVNAVGGILSLPNAAPRILFTQIATVSVPATNTFTTLVGTGIGSMTLPANFFTVGKTVLLRAQGYCGSSTNGQQAFRFTIASTNLNFVPLTPAVAGGGGGVAVAWIAEILITCYATGSSATLMINGKVKVGDNGLDVTSLNPLDVTGDLVPTSPSNIDTTAAIALNLLVKQGASTTVDDVTKMTNMFVMELN